MKKRRDYDLVQLYLAITKLAVKLVRLVILLLDIAFNYKGTTFLKLSSSYDYRTVDS